jgi:hypothetical protein
MLYDNIFDIPARSLHGSDPGSRALPATSIRLRPEIRNAGQIAEVLWKSHDWVYRFQLNDADVVTETPIPSGPDWRFVSWERSNEALIA